MNYYIILITAFFLTACGGGGSENQSNDLISPTVIEDKIEEPTENLLNESNAIFLLKEHLKAVLDSQIPVNDVTQIVLGGSFTNGVDILCDISGTMTKEIIFEQQPNSALTIEGDEIQYSFDNCSNKNTSTINGVINLRYDLYKNDTDITFSSLNSDNFQLELTFNSITDQIFTNSANEVDGYVEYNRYIEGEIDETSVYSSFKEVDHLFGIRELTDVTFTFLINENLAQRHETITGAVNVSDSQFSAMFVTNKTLIRDLNRIGSYSEGSITMTYGDTHAELELFSDDTAKIYIYSNVDNTLIDSLIDVPQSEIFSRLF